jgi:uncharacterized protein YqiB (DUF1249 family)
MTVSSYRKKKRYVIDFPAQMMECEVNYRRLCRLLPHVKSLAVAEQKDVIVGKRAMSEALLSLTVLEQTKYTTVVHIAQYLPLQKSNASIKTTSCDEDIVRRQASKALLYQSDVRLYHDASVAEIVKCQRYQQFKSRYVYPNADMHQIDEKAQMNRFLGELLTHCLLYGRVAETVMV